MVFGVVSLKTLGDLDAVNLGEGGMSPDVEDVATLGAVDAVILDVDVVSLDGGDLVPDGDGHLPDASDQWVLDGGGQCFGGGDLWLDGKDATIGGQVILAGALHVHDVLFGGKGASDEGRGFADAGAADPDAPDAPRDAVSVVVVDDQGGLRRRHHGPTVEVPMTEVASATRQNRANSSAKNRALNP